MKMIELLAAGALAFLFASLLFRLGSGVMTAHENTLYRIRAVNDAAVLVNSFRGETGTMADSAPDTLALRGIADLVRGEKNGENGLRYRELRFILLGKPCRAIAGEVK